jgi:glycosyltransferase involved in cell wall biosynthesis
VAARLAEAYPPEFAHLTAFRPGDAVDLQAKLNALLLLPPHERRGLGLAAREVVVERWSWSGVAKRLLDPLLDCSIT